MNQRIEEISMNAWPALQTIHYDGWILRFANGVTKRSNSVNPIYGSTLDTPTKIRYCEQLYRSKNLPVCIKITPWAKPPGLDQLLEENGYKHEFEVAVQVLSLDRFPTQLQGNVYLAEQTSDEWISEYIRMNKTDPSKQMIIKAIIDQIAGPKCLLMLNRENHPVGCGLGVVEDQYIGLFDIVIDETSRNRGLGRILVEHILNWGKSKGAGMAYLQVLATNAPAIKLYANIGFKEAYRYWYRIKQ